MLHMQVRLRESGSLGLFTWTRGDRAICLLDTAAYVSNDTQKWAEQSNQHNVPEQLTKNVDEKATKSREKKKRRRGTVNDKQK